MKTKTAQAKPTSFPSVDHSLLSPSGRMSKRAREAAIKQEAARLFPAGFWDRPVKTEKEKAEEKALTLRRAAQDLRNLASRMTRTRKYAKAAEKLEKEANDILAKYKGDVI